ncbi:VUT family protein [Shewanella sp. 202IG2-18]|uniref:VUT family protein n=1 Tax=Parashewanella hymeniacidonis TaxID=2807618 RepID=UPI0019613DF6|nr:VUT family protein [Parashewanella hymeniacidonis]MBM7070751.1 VUT family protein [Parashewanella hymeniacidonis]
MTPSSDVKLILKRSYINYLLIGLLITSSIASHLMANRLLDIFGFPVIPATFTYMLVFSLSDMLAALNPRRFVVCVLVGEALANLYWVGFATGVNASPAPEFFQLSQSYQDVFGSVPQLFLANLGGGLIISILDIFLFSHWYRVKKHSFFRASLFSTVVSISAYTYFTDYFGFKGSYPHHVLTLAHVNTITNMMFVLVYSIISAYLMKHIIKYIKSSNIGEYQHDSV